MLVICKKCKRVHTTTEWNKLQQIGTQLSFFSDVPEIEIRKCLCDYVIFKQSQNKEK